MIEFPDFDLEGFYMLAKRINDFLNNPDFEKWAEIITESVKCKTQVMTIELLNNVYLNTDWQI